MMHVLVGLTVLVLGAWGIITWWGDFGMLLRGLIPILLVLTGLVAVGAGFRKTVREDEEEDAEDPFDEEVHRVAD